MRRISCVSVALLASAAFVPTHAQGLTEHQFLEDALQDHPRIAAAEAELDATTGHRRQAGEYPNPELAWEREDADGAARQDTWRLHWRLPFDGRKHRLAEADASVAASKAMIDATQLEARLELRELFAAWYVASAREDVLKDQLDLTRRLAEWLRARADHGEAAGVEAQRLELEVEILAHRHSEVSAAASALRASAAAWSHLVSDGTLPERPALAPPPSSIDLSERPELKALQYRVIEAEARQRIKQRVLAPPELSAGWLEIRDATQSFAGPVFSISWPLPVFDRNQGNREVAAAEVDRSRALLEAARRQALDHAHGTLAAYSELYGSVVSHGFRSSSGEIVDSVLAAFEAGEADLTDVLDALRTIVDVRLARLDSLAATLAAGRDLEAALGRPLLPGGSS